MEVGS